MADNENIDTKEEPKEGEERPTSAGSKGSAGSKKSLGDAVSKLTVKALKEFRLSDPSDAETNVTGAESEGLVPTANFNIDIPSLDLPEGGIGPTLFAENADFNTALDDAEDGDAGVEDEFGQHDGDENLSEDESEGESEMVVLDPDHVRYICKCYRYMCSLLCFSISCKYKYNILKFTFPTYICTSMYKVHIIVTSI